MPYRSHWTALLVLIAGSFAILATGWSLERRSHVDEGSTEVTPGELEAQGRA